MLVPDMRNKGFTLVELVIGIVVFSISMAIITSMVVPQAQRSVAPILQVRATELGQSLLSEITSRSFDENSDRVNGEIRCNEDLNGDGDLDDPGEIACSSVLGPEESSREDFDDVDDYHGLTTATTKNSLGEDLQVDGQNLYEGFSASISVVYYNGISGLPTDAAKLITVTVTTPLGTDMTFSAIRTNF